MVHLSGQEHKLLLTIHHIIADEWSMEVIQGEVTQLYQAFSHGRPSPLPELPIQYADFAVWQRSWMQKTVLEEQVAHWRKELAGANPVLELPADKPRPAVQSFRGATEIFELPKELLQQLKSLGREQQATLFMILEASFAVLLNRYTGQDDILVGTPISGRTRSETENLVGFFLNTVVLRAQFSERMNFRSLLQQVRERALSAYVHPDMPFEQLVAELAPERDASQSPLFQVMFVLHDSAGVSEVSKASGNQELSTGTSKFDLTLVLSETPNGLQGLFEYSTDLFEAETIRGMCGHFQTLLEAIAGDPDQNISKLPMLTDAERRQLLTEWNDTAVSFQEKSLCLHRLIEEQAARTPERTALVFDGHEMTYRELDARANQLANHLRGLGAGPDVLVGLLVERSLEMVVGLLGILKAGGAYVPLDPSFPEHRLSYMVEDSKMKVLVTHRGLEENLAARPSTIVRLDSDWPKIAREEKSSTGEAAPNEKNLAYVLYTSGSTGKPKGVAIPHSAIVNFVLSIQNEPGFTEKDTLLAVTTLSFDIAGLELYVPLITGGKVVIASSEDTRDPARLQERINESRCTVMQATPATWRALIHSGWKGSPNLKILCGGEALPRDLADELLVRCGQLWNMYGPTETTVWSTLQRVKSSDPVSIGKPLANTQIYVLDKGRNLVPRGAVGELYIGGDGLARGYLHREELTRERFVPNPFVRNALIYCTGDMARWLPDGTVECLGRVDNQVKIRGYRIELGEVETLLGSHAGVKQCVVVAREDTPGNKVLAAYFVPQAAGPAPSASDLRAHLKQALPDYMIPSTFIAMERLPLTPNGKIDRKALPAPDDQAADSTRDSAAPRDAIEQMLSHIWAKVLGVKRIGLHDNFFDLGGHSLLAVRIMAEVEKLFGTRLPLATLLQAPTVAELAEILRKKNWTPAWSSLVPIRPGGSKPPLFLMHSHGGNVIEYYPLANQLDPDQPMYALQTRGLDGKIEKGASIEEMAASYLEEVRSFQPQGPYYLGGFCLGGALALAAAQQLTEAGEEVALVILIQSMHPDATRFKPGTTWTQRFWYQASKRIDLEMENLSHRGGKYILERWQHLWNRAGARAAILLDRVAEKTIQDSSKLPMNYILEVLGDEHGRALQEFSPRPYAGDVALFRASKQLAGQNADEILGWRDVLTGRVDICEIPGHQQNMMLLPNVIKLGKEITSRMNAAQERREAKTPVEV
jgi:amino acid adenylation domain-containing protein